MQEHGRHSYFSFFLVLLALLFIIYEQSTLNLFMLHWLRIELLRQMACTLSRTSANAGVTGAMVNEGGTTMRDNFQTSQN